MWLYFNKNGQLLETLEHGSLPSAGTTDFEIFAFFEGLDILSDFTTATLKLIKPDLDNTEYPNLLMNLTTAKFIKLDTENAIYFKNGTIYNGYKFNFSDFTNTQEVETLLDTAGTWKAVISLFKNGTTKKVQGTITFSVGNGIEDVDGNVFSIDTLFNTYNIELSKYLPKKTNLIIKLVEDITSVTKWDTSIYNLDDIILDKKGCAFYKLVQGSDDENILTTESYLNLKQILANLNTKQDALVSGKNIKTVNGETLLGEGDLTVTAESVNWGNINGTIADQSDLVSKLDEKQDKNTSVFGVPSTIENALLRLLNEKQSHYVTVNGYSQLIDTVCNNLYNDKANKATTLEGYGITDAYTKEAVDSEIEQVRLVASGKVKSYVISLKTPEPSADNWSSFFGGKITKQDGSVITTYEEFNTYTEGMSFANDLFNSENELIAMATAQNWYFLETGNADGGYNIIIIKNTTWHKGDVLLITEVGVPDRWCDESGLQWYRLETTKVDISNKTDKLSGANETYLTDANGNMGSIEVSADKEANTIVSRSVDGNSNFNAVGVSGDIGGGVSFTTTSGETTWLTKEKVDKLDASTVFATGDTLVTRNSEGGTQLKAIEFKNGGWLDVGSTNGALTFTRSTQASDANTALATKDYVDNNAVSATYVTEQVASAKNEINTTVEPLTKAHSTIIIRDIKCGQSWDKNKDCYGTSVFITTYPINQSVIDEVNAGNVALRLNYRNTKRRKLNKGNHKGYNKVWGFANSFYCYDWDSKEYFENDYATYLKGCLIHITEKDLRTNESGETYIRVVLDMFEFAKKTTFFNYRQNLYMPSSQTDFLSSNCYKYSQDYYNNDITLAGHYNLQKPVYLFLSTGEIVSRPTQKIGAWLWGKGVYKPSYKDWCEHNTFPMLQTDSLCNIKTLANQPSLHKVPELVFPLAINYTSDEYMELWSKHIFCNYRLQFRLTNRTYDYASNASTSVVQPCPKLEFPQFKKCRKYTYTQTVPSFCILKENYETEQKYMYKKVFPLAKEQITMTYYIDYQVGDDYFTNDHFVYPRYTTARPTFIANVKIKDIEK